MQRFLFLDIDGVLASDEEWGIFLDDKCCAFNGAAVTFLNHIVEQVPDVQIILASTWRKGKSLSEIRALFEKRGFKYPNALAGKTIVLEFTNPEINFIMTVPRGCEIEAYIRQNTFRDDAYKYVIVDDSGDMMLWQKDIFIQTKELLTLDDAKRIVALLQ